MIDDSTSEAEARDGSPHEPKRELLAWRNPGFSAHVGDTIPPEDQQHLLDTAAQRGTVNAPRADMRDRIA